jgi:hypothetical protein
MTNNDRKYPTLGANFMKGSVAGQINSIHRTRETQPEKLAEFKQAIARRDIPIRASQLTPASRKKLAECGIVQVKGARAQLGSDTPPTSIPL